MAGKANVFLPFVLGDYACHLNLMTLSNSLLFLFSYSSAIAPTGHWPAHAPQEMQTAGSISNFESPALIAPTGH